MNRLAELLLNKTLDECTADELKRITDKYPYFNAGHLLAAVKTQSPDTAEAKAIIQKAGLHFRPAQLSALINYTGNAVSIQKEITETITTLPLAEPIIEKTKEIAVSVPEASFSTDTQLVAEPEEKIIEEEILPGSHQTNNDQPETNNQQPVLEKILEEKPASGTEQQAIHELPLAFEPFHTVDYFASQGIKVKLEDNPPDKFTKQLRSFTEWLKTMKKLPVTEGVAPVVNETTEKKVEQLAEVSLTDSNVVTEAMAEVWVKQGNPQKAIEIYHKLSLLEPAKSPYFASRISDLKNN